MPTMVFECDVCGAPWDTEEEAIECCDFGDEDLFHLPDEIEIRHKDGKTMMKVPAKLYGKCIAINRDISWVVTHVPSGTALTCCLYVADAERIATSLAATFTDEELQFTGPESNVKPETLKRMKKALIRLGVSRDEFKREVAK